MQIVIPMSGTGQRFLDAGYKLPKPLIEVDGKPIIEHVVDLFPKENKIIFICNEEHLKHTKMRAVLKRISPSAKIFSIPSHKKGPVYAVSAIFDQLNDDEETIVNYCDFSKFWNYRGFLKKIRSLNADGAVSAYKGFHPHMLSLPNYAFIRENKKTLLEIREKQPFTENRMQEYASDGTYYFRSGRYVKHYFKQLMQENINTNGEFYVSMVYNLMKKDGLRIAVYEIEHMLQWGAPRDLEEYQRWSEYFKKILKKQKNIKPLKKSLNLVLLAGRGKRFVDAGYAQPKPLIKINKKPMFLMAASFLPFSKKYIFACLAEHLDGFRLEKAIKNEYTSVKIIRIDKVTEGQACTCRIALKGEDLESPLLVASCDSVMLWNKDKYAELLNDPKVDIIVWTFRHHSASERNPHMYGWVKIDGLGNILKVSVKNPISQNPCNDHAIIGNFYFKKAKYFIDSFKKLYVKNIRVNNEFYVDSCINELLDMGLKAKVFEVENYVCFGTPDDLKTYEYWQKFFNKCKWHPYQIKKDRA